ncbi:MAG: DUF3501 family protein [Woeseiaceae bacterium]
MKKLAREDLYSLEKYATLRNEFRSEVMEHKRDRRLPLGRNVTLYFEDRLTMQYQIQEMLRIERIFEADEVESELEAYNPLIPDGSNWKATFMVEFPDVAERLEKLRQLVGIENQVWMQIGESAKVYAIADEDMKRADEQKTSAVHFLRFELDPQQVAALKEGAPLAAGIDHDKYRVEVRPVPDHVRRALLADLD